MSVQERIVWTVIIRCIISLVTEERSEKWIAQARSASHCFPYKWSKLIALYTVTEIRLNTTTVMIFVLLHIIFVHYFTYITSEFISTVIKVNYSPTSSKNRFLFKQNSGWRMVHSALYCQANLLDDMCTGSKLY